MYQLHRNDWASQGKGYRNPKAAGSDTRGCKSGLAQAYYVPPLQGTRIAMLRENRDVPPEEASQPFLACGAREEAGIPVRRSELRCPNCQTKGLYQSHEFEISGIPVIRIGNY